ncbi:hypothetical protein D3C80_1241700 [compost metagenome]
MQRLHQAEFILRAGTRKNIKFLRGVAQLAIVHHFKLAPGNGIVGVADTQHFANAHRRLRVIASNHFDANARLQTVADRSNGLRTRWVHHSGNPKQNHAMLQIIMHQLRLLQTRGFPGRRNHAQPFARILLDFRFPVRLVERLKARFSLLVLTQPEQHIRGTGNQNQLFIPNAVKGRHIFVL